ALSFGNEFQQRTISLLLSQPVDRMRIWTAKWAVLISAVLSSVIVYSVGDGVFSQAGFPDVVFAGACLIIALCSGTFWTLVARSTIGGLVFTLMESVVIVLLGGLVVALMGPQPSPAAARIALSVGVVAVFFYSSLMLWLGRWKLTRFQATGGLASDDLMMSSPDALGSIL